MLSHDSPQQVQERQVKFGVLLSPHGYYSPNCSEALKETIESVAFSNTNSLNDQQLTSEDIPVIVDKSISFVYGHGCMTEGIYR